MKRWHWPAMAEDLPQLVQQESSSIELTGITCYPYWLLDALIYIKAPLLSRVTRRWIVAVDAISGAISVPPPMPPFMTEDSGEGLNIIEPIFTLAGIDHNRLQRMAVDQVGRKLRSWMNVKVEIERSRLVYKEIRMFHVTFKNNSSTRMALDSLTGEYGIVR